MVRLWLNEHNEHQRNAPLGRKSPKRCMVKNKKTTPKKESFFIFIKFR